MATLLTTDDAKQSLSAHVAGKGAEICQKYGPRLGWTELQLLLADRAFVRYPCKVVFDASPLQAGEFAYPQASGEKPEDGFAMHIHPVYMLDLARVPYLVLYQLVAVNYGAFASADDAEIFGARALGLSREEYYAALCEMADQLDAGNLEAAHLAPGCGGGCGCS